MLPSSSFAQSDALPLRQPFGANSNPLFGYLISRRNYANQRRRDRHKDARFDKEPHNSLTAPLAGAKLVSETATKINEPATIWWPMFFNLINPIQNQTNTTIQQALLLYMCDKLDFLGLLTTQALENPYDVCDTF
jgi:hypothetical protein